MSYTQRMSLAFITDMFPISDSRTVEISKLAIPAVLDYLISPFW